MEMPKNAFKAAINAGKPQIGLWCSIPSNYAAELLAGAGFDWLLLDTEHTPVDIETVVTQLQAIAPYPTTPIVRVPVNDKTTIKRYLDTGAQTLLIPMVDTVEDAKAAVAYTRFPETGFRGVAGATRATRFGRIKNYHVNAHKEICTLIQVESRESLKHIEAMAEIEGIDGIFVGPADLHASLGYLGERAHKDVMPVIDDAIRRIAKAGKAPGILTDSEENARRWLDCGATFVAVGADTGLLARNAEALAAKFKK
ncbi:MAG TPA: HpcH/HpaI aldolase/citrate lyase family protein [Xanthobacteraceae bacterium]|jgi:4-hydroxy-2-oxoheptanedioate aldolase|nr:HpcH/HpaI aldolase/citrate lyase family protein [Xanthobacteraceae bacterium]